MPIAHDAILKSMADGVIILDTQQRVVEINPAAQNIIGGNRSEILGRQYNQVLPGQLGLLELKRGMGGTEAAIILGQGQEQHFYGVRITPIGTLQHLSGHLVILHDDTQRMKAEAASKERVILETELNERKRAAEAIQRRLEFEETIAKVSSRFVGISDLDVAINNSLADIGMLSRQVGFISFYSAAQITQWKTRMIGMLMLLAHKYLILKLFLSMCSPNGCPC